MRACGSQRGAALIAAILIAVSVLGLCFVLTTSLIASFGHKRSMVAGTRAADAAESGMHHLVAALNGSDETSVLANGGLQGILMGDEDSDRAVRYVVRLAPAGADGVDNDLDGVIDDSDEARMVEAVSVGFADGVASALGATLLRMNAAASMPGAVLWDNDDLTLQLDSSGDQTNLLISGIDQDLDGNPTGTLRPGVAVHGDPAWLRQSIPSPRYDNDIVGQGGTPDVQQAGEEMDYQVFIDYARMNYDVRLDKQGYPNVSTPQPWGTPDSPMVVYAKGDYIGDHVDIDQRPIVGAGILVVDGSLEVADAQAVLDWKGLVIIRSKLLIDSDAHFSITGGMVMHGPYQHSQIDDATVTIQYSSQALSRAFGILVPDTYLVYNWRVAPVPPSLLSTTGVSQ